MFIPRTCVSRLIRFCLSIAFLVSCSMTQAGESELKAAEEIIRRLVASNDDWKQVYQGCLGSKGGGERIALACTASTMVNLELVLEVCADRGDNPLDCYGAQMQAVNRFNNFASASKGQPHDINAAANVCVTLHRRPIDNAAQRSLLNFVAFVNDGKEMADDDIRLAMNS